MKRSIVGTLLGVALLALGAVAARADELTVNSILSAHRSGAPAEGIIAMVNSPDNTVAMTAADIVTLRNAGVPEGVITEYQVNMMVTCVHCAVVSIIQSRAVAIKERERC